jgi:hypothetical protein
MHISSKPLILISFNEPKISFILLKRSVLTSAFSDPILDNFFLTEKKNILKKKLTGNTLLIFNDFIDNQIQIYNHYMHKL